MARSTQLKKFCEIQHITLEKCRKSGCYLLCMAQRPDYSTFSNIMRTLKEIGYTYIQDGQDSEGYFMNIKAA